MPADKRLMGLFKDPDQVIEALKAFKASTWSVVRVHSPIPNHKIAHALDLPKSKVGYFTLSGKPVVALVPFFIVGFEFTILFSVFGNVIGLINVGGLPDWEGLTEYDPRCSGDHYGITVACDADSEDELRQFFQERGAQIRDLSALPQTT
jgi:molybdopterin-containing oxidoreductase family membrane subunit